MGAGIHPVLPPTQPVASRPARNSWRRKGAPPVSRASQAARSMSEILVEVLVRIESSHASASSGCDGLTIHVIGDIASGKYSGHAGGGGAAVTAGLDHDIAFAHLELSGKDAGVRCMTDGDEGTGHIEVFDG